MLELRTINQENWYKCTQLKITEEQRSFFPCPPVYWLAECRYRPDWHEFAIYSDNKMVGFAVYGLDPDNNEYWINAIMIDKEYQGNGYGRAATIKLIETIKLSHKSKKIYLGHREKNTIAAKLYESLGFEDTGERYDGEIIRCLCIK